MDIWDGLKEAERDLSSALYNDREFRRRFDQDKSSTYGSDRRPQRDRVEGVRDNVRGAMNEVDLTHELEEMEYVDWVKWRPGNLNGNLLKLFRKRNMPSDVEEKIEEHDCVAHELKKSQHFKIRCPRKFDEKVR